MMLRPSWPYECWPSYPTHDFDKDKCLNDEQQAVHEISETIQGQDCLNGSCVSSTHSYVVSSDDTVKDALECCANTTKLESDMGKNTSCLPSQTLAEKGTNNEKCESSENLSDSYEPAHWDDELEYKLSDDNPLNIMLNAILTPKFCQAEAEQIRTALTAAVDMTLKTLTNTYKVFKDSYYVSVGSMSENTKVGRADEFDFAVIIPTLSSKEVISLFHSREIAAKDPNVMSFISDIWSGDLESATWFFQEGLRNIWCLYMKDFIPEGWVILNPSGHTDTSSVAATFHLERQTDTTRVDIDVCFWAPLDKDCLDEELTSNIPHAEYVLMNCLDEDGKVFAILPVDSGIDYSTNTVRFAMSKLEKANLQKLGSDSTIIDCYKICKCVVSTLLPKIKKKKECDYCYESVISSYAMKNIILYMIHNHKDEKLWTREQMANRVLEVFTILCFCVKVNSCLISAFFTPYVLSIDMFDTYDPIKKCLTNKTFILIEHDEIPCILPNFSDIKDLFSEDATSKKAVTDYEIFLKDSSWRHPEVICRLTELLSNLAQPTEEERLEMVNEPGWNLFLLDLPKHDAMQIYSVDTKM